MTIMISINKLCVSLSRAVLTENRGVSPLFGSLVRHRKSRWDPKAKSKEFYVRKPTEIDPEEYEELIPRYRIYRTYMKSLK